MKSRRLIAIIISIVMLLPVLAFAQEAEFAGRVMQVFASGKTLETNISYDVDKDTVGMIISMFMSSNMDAGDEAKAEASAKVQDAILNIINKLRIDLVSNDKSFSGTIGSEKAPLFDIAGNVSAENDEFTMSLGILPGYVLSMPIPKDAIQAQMESQNIEKINELSKNVKKALNDYVEGVLVPAFEESKDNFIMNDKEFDLGYAGMFNSHMLAKLFKAASEFIASSEEIKGYFDMALSNQAKAMENVVEKVEEAEKIPEEKIDNFNLKAFKEQPKNAEELIAKLNDGAEELLSKDAKDLASVSLYKNTANMDTMIEVTPMDNSAHIVSYASGDSKNIDVKFILNGEEPDFNMPGVDTADKAEPAEEAKAVDWKQLEEDVVKGNNFTASVVKISANDLSDDDNLGGDVSFNMVFSGMPIGVSYSVKETKTGAYKAEAKCIISIMSNKPTITINVVSQESDKAVAPVAEGKKVSITEEGSQTVNKDIKDLLDKNAPAVLLANLPEAFPEEGETIMNLMQQTKTESGVTQSN